jgi:hypothetical protein
MSEQKRLPHYSMERFIDRVWRELFRTVLEPEKEKRWSYTAVFAGTTCRIYEFTGRVVVTFERNGEDVTYITHDRDPFGENFGLQGYHGSYWNHHESFEEIIRGWEAFGAPMFKYNKNQSIG